MPNNRKTHEWFVEQANKIYGDAFTYLTKYETARIPIIIRCEKCGQEFKKVPNLHLRQPHGCISCAQVTDRCTILSQVQHEILEGLMISDSGITRQILPNDRLSTPIFSIKSIQKDFVDYIIKNIPFEFSNRLDAAKITIRKNTTICSKAIGVLQSKSDNALIPYWERWYGGEEKCVPKDFVLTPTTARFWFYGDGSSSSHKNGENVAVRVRLCTNSFTKNDCDWLCQQWQRVGVNFYTALTNRKNKEQAEPVLTLDVADDINKFFDYIGEPEVECFRYKWKRPVDMTYNGQGKIYQLFIEKRLTELVSKEKMTDSQLARVLIQENIANKWGKISWNPSRIKVLREKLGLPQYKISV